MSNLYEADNRSKDLATISINNFQFNGYYNLSNNKLKNITDTTNQQFSDNNFNLKLQQKQLTAQHLQNKPALQYNHLSSKVSNSFIRQVSYHFYYGCPFRNQLSIILKSIDLFFVRLKITIDNMNILTQPKHQGRRLGVLKAVFDREKLNT